MEVYKVFIGRIILPIAMLLVSLFRLFRDVMSKVLNRLCTGRYDLNVVAIETSEDEKPAGPSSGACKC